MIFKQWLKSTVTNMVLGAYCLSFLISLCITFFISLTLFDLNYFNFKKLFSYEFNSYISDISCII